MDTPNTLLIKTKTQSARRQARRGFTLLETMTAFGILALLGASFMTLYVNIVASSGRTSANAIVSMDAAKAVDRISLTLREARRFEFMDNGTSGPSAYQTPATLGNNPNYMATISGTAGGATIVTGLRIVHAAPLTTVAVSVPSSSGYVADALIGRDALADYRTDGGYLDIYRSDRQGHPAPRNGTCLWMRGTLDGLTVRTDPQADTRMGIDGEPLIENVASWAGAVQFLQGQTNEVHIKIVTGATLRSGAKQVTSDSGAGKVSSLTAVDAYLRNHDPSGVTANSVHGKTQYGGE